MPTLESTKKAKSEASISAKNERLFTAYRILHEQGFVVHFTGEELDSKMLVEACLEAGMKGIEYTLRRPDAAEMIPWVRKHYPELMILVGSTVDSDRIVHQMRKKHPQLLTLKEVADMDIHGFVSLMGWSLESIRKYSKTHLVIPATSGITEGLMQVDAGAHFCKLIGMGLEDVAQLKACRGPAGFGFCPIMAAGTKLEHVPAFIEADAVLVGCSFNRLLGGDSKGASHKKIVNVLKEALQVTNEARAKKWPDMMNAVGKDQAVWLAALPHFHPFGE